MESKINFNKIGQLGVFVIIAIVIVAGILGFFLLRGQVGQSNVPAELEEVYDYYQSCIEQEVDRAVDISSVQGGRIDVGAYVPGSDFAPYSSHLNFMGLPVPYWFYVSGNGVVKENVPSKTEIEKEFSDFIQKELESCDFSVLRDRGFGIEFGEIENVDVRIDSEEIRVNVQGALSSNKGEVKGVKRNHEVVLNSKFGEFYQLASEIYARQRETGFLEEYSVDVLRNYAPVDGVEIQCQPKIWKTGEVEEEIKSGLTANLGKLKVEGDSYELEDKEERYFVIEGLDSGNANTRFMYSKNWPTKLEIEGEGVDQELIVAEAVGNQEGLGAMGFCYVSYHYVYDLGFPVLVQVYQGEEIFQFPVNVVIENNLPREVYLESESLSGFEEEFDLCEYKTQEIEVNVYDNNLNPVQNGRVYYECFDQSCSLGSLENGKVSALAPSCVNGYVSVRTEGYRQEKRLFSSNSQSKTDIILQREYDVSVTLQIDGVEKDENSMVIFSNLDNGESVSTILPENQEIRLSEGEYEIRVYAYSNSSLVIPGSTKTECQEVPRSGVGGILGFTKEECFDISIPETKVEYALVGGGTGEEFILESELQDGAIKIGAPGTEKPKSLEELQNNFIAVDSNKAWVVYQ